MGCGAPPKVSPGICLSFDDRSVEEWYAMRPLLNKYNAKVTFFVTQFDSLTKLEIMKLKELENEGHEIGSHGAIHVLAEKYIQENSYSLYLENEVDASLIAMRLGGFNPISFAYPYGSNYWFTDFLIAQKFDLVRNVYPYHLGNIRQADKVFTKPGERKVLWSVGIDGHNPITINEIEVAFKRVVERNEILLLYGHKPKSDSHDEYSFDIIFLEEILKQAQSKKLVFYRIRDLK